MKSGVFAAIATIMAASPAQGPTAEQDELWRRLQALCGRAFEGRLVEAPPGDTTFEGKRLVMLVHACDAGTIRVPFHVGDDRSRTWVVSRQPSGLRLKHDHRHPDGTEDAITQYGGDTASPGTAERQEFPADAFTAQLIPAARTNVWSIELHPGRVFVYALRREGTDRRFRIEFDLTRTIVPDPSPDAAK